MLDDWNILKIQNGPKIELFGLSEKDLFSFSWKSSKMNSNIVIDFSPPIPYLAKLWFLSHGPKCCCQIKLQNSLKSNISRKNFYEKSIFTY